MRFWRFYAAKQAFSREKTRFRGLLAPVHRDIAITPGWTD
jgi:hypothetical protein